MRAYTFTMLFFLLPFLAFAIREDRFEQDYQDLVAPYNRDNGEPGEFAGTDNLKIRYIKYEVENEKGAIVFLNGRTESYLRYEEFAYDLRDAGFSLYMLDHRGQGLSERMLPDPQKGYVRRYGDYVRDVKIFVDTVVNQKHHGKLFLVGHSLGGAIAAAYLQTFPNDFRAAVLCSPQLQLTIGPFGNFVVRLLSFFGRGKAYAPTQGPYARVQIEQDKATHSAVRHEQKYKTIDAHPEIRLGGATVNWLKESIKLGSYAMHHAREISLPLFLFKAGEEAYVSTKAQDVFSKRAPNCRTISFPGAWHEILIEKDEIRDRALNELTKFFSQYAQ